MSSQRVLGLLCTLAGAAGVTALTARSSERLPSGATASKPRALPATRPLATLTHIEAARSFNHSSALLALSVLTDSALEHYRGSFDNPVMWTPLVCASLALAASLIGTVGEAALLHFRGSFQHRAMYAPVSVPPVAAALLAQAARAFTRAASRAARAAGATGARISSTARRYPRRRASQRWRSRVWLR